MQRSDWIGVMPAITTPFNDAGDIDIAFMRRHARQMIEAGSTAMVTPGSLGEGGTLTHEEKVTIWSGLSQELSGRAPVVAAISALSTAEAVELARLAEANGCEGLMVLPPYAYDGRWAETRAHFEAIIEATPLSCMLYNNPLAYSTDIVPEQVLEMAGAHANLHAVKESSGDIRRIAELRRLLGDRLAIFAGIDDLVVEAVDAGADGWIAGLVNALPVESVKLFDLARGDDRDACRELYEWFLPLLRLDAVPEFVHLVKLCQSEFGLGNERLRMPRMALEGELRDRALMIIAEAKMNHARI